MLCHENRLFQAVAGLPMDIGSQSIPHTIRGRQEANDLPVDDPFRWLDSVIVSQRNRPWRELDEEMVAIGMPEMPTGFHKA